MEISFDHFQKGSTIITPNRRLAATLTKKYHQYQIDQGIKSWPSIDILPYPSFIQRLWQQYVSTTSDVVERVLIDTEETLLWEEILKNSPYQESLLQISDTAAMAKSAFGILQQWQISLDNPALELTEDSRAFLTWAKAFIDKCEENNWIHQGAISTLLQQKEISLPKKIVTIGFTEFTPEQTRFLSTLNIPVTIVENFTIKHADPILQRITLSDTEKEIETMARFAKLKGKNATVGCIVPNLEKNRDRVFQIFSQVFKDEDASFNISAGRSLSRYPVIDAAIKLLKLLHREISASGFSEILCSPFLGDAEYECHTRANFDLLLRKSNIITDVLPKILKKDSKLSLEQYCPKLYARLTTKKWNDAALSMAEWVNVFIDILTTFGWPGERSLNSHEYQVVQRFLNALQDFQSVSLVLPHKKYHDALHYFIRMTNSTVFQPESRDAPVQVLGMLEAADIPFDYLWVMNMDDETMPSLARPNPFIPNILQRKHKMPHANAERELQYSLRLLEQLKRSTNQLIFSHAKVNNDCERFCSALTQMYPEITMDDLDLADYSKDQDVIFHSREIESFIDEVGPALIPDERIQGGVNILKQQSACPFKAFASIRLHAEKLPSPILGLQASERGIIVHKVLELMWKNIGNSTALKKLNDADLKQMLYENIQFTMKEVSNFHEPRYIQLEMERMHYLLWEWFSLEKNRPDFTVMSIEQKREVKIGPLDLTLRIDRIDQLSDGSHLIIDYKTSKNNSLKYWFSHRPDEPQLPLYCITHPIETGGIAFAEIQAKAFSLKGIVKNSSDVKTMIPFHQTEFAENKTWDEQLQSWQHILEKISEDFYRGVASVDPKHPLETCQYCHLQSLCRIHEKELNYDN